LAEAHTQFYLQIELKGIEGKLIVAERNHEQRTII